jgi:hypothetical protein
VHGRGPRNDPINKAFEQGNVFPLDTVRRSHVMLKS